MTNLAANFMEQRLKQRLTGAVTLVSLAVIFLPMVFDGSGYKNQSNVNFETPAQPSLIFDQRFKNIPDGGADGIKKLREQINVRELTKKSFQESALQPTWLIQAGVFSVLENARLQTEKLKQNGYAAKYKKVGKNFVVEIGSVSEKAARKMVVDLEVLGIKDLLIHEK